MGYECNACGSVNWSMTESDDYDAEITYVEVTCEDCGYLIEAYEEHYG